ncbi:MAG: radical SAM family heme chaperone HemW [Litorimonas sp.]
MPSDNIEDLAVYIHWPYCTRICPYCDFNVYKDRQDNDLHRAICADLLHWRQWSGPRRVRSIHFGGGTPSLLSGPQISLFVKHVSSLWQLADNCEVALEANPNDANEAQWRAYNLAGVNRVSLGVQTFQDKGLKLLGRDHDSAQAKAALRLAKDIFPKVSADLIYGWAGQDEFMLRQDLEALLAYDIGHISAYQLTIEDGTSFANAQSRGDIKSVDADISADFYDLVRGTLKGAGFSHYEVSNFTKEGGASQHNLAYWQGRDYVGVGPGAHGRMTLDADRYASIAALKPADYITRIETEKMGIESETILTPQAWGEEYVIMGLRIKDGISMSRYEDITGKALPQNVINILIGDGMLIQDNGRLMASAQGRLVLNKITEMLLISD